MEYDGFGDGSGSAFSPARNLAGPSRTRSLRGSDRKPYARPAQNGGATPLASSPLVRRRGSEQEEEEERLSPLAARTTPTTATVPRSGLFSTLTRAITKPLSWLSTSSHPIAQSDRRSLLPSSASTGSVADLAERRAATRSGRLRGKDSYLSNMETGDIESHATTSNLNAAPTKPMAGAGLGGMSSSASMSAIAPRSRTRHFDSPSDMLPPSASAASPPSSRRTLNIARTAATSRGTDADLGLASGGPSSPVFSSASAAIRAHGRQGSLQPSSSLHRLATYQSTPAVRRGGSIAPSESSSMRNGESGNSLNNKSPAYAYGFGSERRLGGLTSEALASKSAFGPTSGLTPSSSLSHLPSRSPFATRLAPEPALKRSGSVAGGSLAGNYAQSEFGAGGDAASSSRLFGPATPTRLGASVLGGGSRAMSPALSRSGSALGLSSRTRPWSSLNLAPPRGKPSDGEEMMKDLASARKFGTPTGSAAPSVMGARDSRANTPLSARLGKRDASEALELGGGFGALDLQDRGSEMGSVSGSARKKQMVWDPELGFISMDDLRAREPPTAVPRNEAERILGVLEGMRTPLGDARKEGALGGRTRSGTSTPSRLTQSISVPLPSPSAARAAQSTPDTRRGTRASSRLNQSTPAPGEDSMRAKLKRTTRATGTPATTRGSRRRAQSEHGSEDEDDAQDEAGENTHGEEEEEREPSPPRRVTRGMARAKRECTITPPPPTRSSKAAGRKTPLKGAPAANSPARRSKRGKAKSPSPQPVEEQMEEEEEEEEEAQPETRQATEPADAAEPSGQAPARSKSKFQVLTADASSSSNSRARSSLRQGIVKTSRTHGKSGKISAWDSDDDEGGEDGTEDGEMAGVDIGELKKIQLPKDFFPSGFKFGTAATGGSDASSAPAASQPKAADKPERPAQTTLGSSSQANGDGAGASLLGRLGGFAASPVTTTPAKSPPSKPSSGFSFQPAAKSGGTSTAPAFSFATPPLPASQPSSERASKPSPAPSDFFAKPPAPAANAAGQADEAPKKGPIPNFFGSANKPAESGSLTVPSADEPRTSPAPFSFGPPSTQSTEKRASPSPSPAPTFSFGKAAEASKPAPSASNATTPSGGFSFGSSAASSPAQPSSEAPKKSVPNFFGAAADKAPESAAAPAPAPAPSTSNPFGSLGGAEKSGNASPFGGFGAAKADSKEDSAPKVVGSGFSFGAPPSATATSNKAAPSASPFGGFTGFGAAPAASSSSAGASGEKQKRGADDDQGAGGEPVIKKSVGFSFGNTSTNAATNGSGTGFSFGAPPSSTASESNKSASPAPFSFGGASTANDASQSGQPSTTSSTAGGFNFGSAANSSAGGSVPASPAPTTTGFSFGQTSGSTSGATQSAGAPTGGFSFKPATTSGSTSAPSTGGFSFGKPPSSTTDTVASKPFSFGAPATPAQPASNGGAAAGNDMMDDTSPSQNYSSTTQNNTGGFGSGGFGEGTKPISGASSTGGFSFGSPAPAPVTAQGTTSGFSFGASSKPSSVPSFSFGAPSGSSSAPPFGAVGSGPSTPTATPGGFNFGTPSSAAPASPAPSNAAGGGINFNFALSQPASSTNGATGGSTPFMFGGATSGQPNGAPANGAGPGTGAGGMFQFGSTAPGTPSAGSATGAAAPFQFGASGGAPAGGASVPGSPAPPGQPVLFNIGAGGGAPPLGGAGGAPGGRQLKGLPRPRRR